jgi:hypothetical protein
MKNDDVAFARKEKVVKTSFFFTINELLSLCVLL